MAELIDIACELRAESTKGYKLYDGKTMEEKGFI